MNIDFFVIVVVILGIWGDRLFFCYFSMELINYGVFEKCMYYFVVVYWVFFVIICCVFCYIYFDIVS